MNDRHQEAVERALPWVDGYASSLVPASLNGVGFKDGRPRVLFHKTLMILRRHELFKCPFSFHIRHNRGAWRHRTCMVVIDRPRYEDEIELHGGAQIPQAFWGRCPSVYP